MKWENYDDSVLRWVNGEGGHPGAPPAGYVESYKVRHPRALLPADFPRTEEAWRARHVPGECWSCCATAGNSETEDCKATAQRAPAEDSGVFFPNNVWSTLPNHQAIMTRQVGQLVRGYTAAPTVPHAMAHFQPKSFGRHAKFQGPKGGPVAAKGFKRHQVAKAMYKWKG